MNTLKGPRLKVVPGATTLVVFRPPLVGRLQEELLTIVTLGPPIQQHQQLAPMAPTWVFTTSTKQVG